MDYNEEGFGTPLVRKRLADAVAPIAGADIQRIPATVEGDVGEWEILNVLACVDCIDHGRSQITYYPDNDPRYPRKPRGVLELIISPAKASGYHMFRVSDWRVAVLVSEQVKDAVEAIGATGVQFTPVC